ncbi:hypothetical protein N0V90_010516 [Kalmusia sp. IMI 367209]|nr:hypothetical protein N0V90_010516 [Kalmusia sp. IMI 367209]
MERLPNELLDQIFDYLLQEEKDVLAWGLSSSVIWSFILRHVHLEHERTVGMLAGKEVGFYNYIAASDDVFVCRAVWKEISPTMNPAIHTDQRHLSAVTRTPAQRWIEALHAARNRDGSFQTKGWIEFTAADWKNIERDLSPYMYPQDRVWVLRNLTTSEFVRSDKLQPSARKSSGDASRRSASGPSMLSRILKPFTSGTTTGGASTHQSHIDRRPDRPFDTTPLTFAQIFLILACHSDVPSYHETIFGFHNGRWCGHRFDIIPLNTHLAETTEVEWADVSELAVDDVANLRYWVQQLDGKGSSCPKTLRPHVEADRSMYHNWEGLDAPLSVNRPKGKWMLKKPMETGFLLRA